ncbi:MAG: tetratricopeptide repeat protein, partial [Dolichospermum sp.]
MYTENRAKSQIHRSVNETLHTRNVKNQQVYQRLKLSLSLGLRRQILFAICDDLKLRNRIAARLHSLLAYPVGNVLYQQKNKEEFSTQAYPRLVTWRLNVTDPNPIAQINQWLVNYPPPIVGGSKNNSGRPLPTPGFQIVGVEMLTKEPVAVQRLFLNYLRLGEQHLSSQEFSHFVESSLLFWVSRPWLSAIQQS